MSNLPRKKVVYSSIHAWGLLIMQCKTKIGLRNILCSIKKEQKGWWKRLLKSEEKPAPYIKVDWNKWCDEDDEESDCKFILYLTVFVFYFS